MTIPLIVHDCMALNSGESRLSCLAHSVFWELAILLPNIYAVCPVTLALRIQVQRRSDQRMGRNNN